MKRFIAFLLPILIVVLAGFAAKKMIESRKRPPKVPSQETIIPVEVMTAHRQTVTPMIEASGTVIPALAVDLRAQVGGLVVEAAAGLMPGGYLEKGAFVLQIDDRDYRYNVERRKADLERARFEVLNEKGLGAVAKQEWQQLGGEVDSSDEGKALSLREPHLERAKASFEAAKGSLEEAELNLTRTRVTAPFNCLLRNDPVKQGQVITPQTVIARITGTDEYWIQVAVPIEALQKIQLPDLNGQGGATVRIVHESGTARIEKTGTVIRLLSDLDPQGRMARLLVSVPDPLAIHAKEKTLPLLLDAFVNVSIQGSPIDNAIALPSHTLHEGNKVWVADKDDRLVIREVRLLWSEKGKIIVGEGIEDGDRVITSRIAVPLTGLKLQVKEGLGGDHV